jgi:hypothetical protein
MRLKIGPCILIGLLAATGCAQSLSEAARKEAERRKQLEEEGISGKIIAPPEPAALGENPSASVRAGPVSQKPPSRSNTGSRARSFRTRLQKFDRDIQATQERIAAVKAQLDSDRAAPIRLGQSRSSGGAGSTQRRLQAQLEQLQSKLERLRLERLKTYGEGLKDGFLPGELDGHGIIP